MSDQYQRPRVAGRYYIEYPYEDEDESESFEDEDESEYSEDKDESEYSEDEDLSVYSEDAEIYDQPPYHEGDSSLAASEHFGGQVSGNDRVARSASEAGNQPIYSTSSRVSYPLPSFHQLYSVCTGGDRGQAPLYNRTPTMMPAIHQSTNQANTRVSYSLPSFRQLNLPSTGGASGQLPPNLHTPTAVNPSDSAGHRLTYRADGSMSYPANSHYGYGSTSTEARGGQPPHNFGAAAHPHPSTRAGAGSASRPLHTVMLPVSNVDPRSGYNDGYGSHRSHYENIAARDPASFHTSPPQPPVAAPLDWSWTKEETDRIVLLRSRGTGYNKIAAELGRTPSACRSRHHHIQKQRKASADVVRRVQRLADGPDAVPHFDKIGEVEVAWTTQIDEWIRRRLRTTQSEQLTSPEPQRTVLEILSMVAAELNVVNGTNLSFHTLRHRLKI